MHERETSRKPGGNVMLARSTVHGGAKTTRVRASALNKIYSSIMLVFCLFILLLPIINNDIILTNQSECVNQAWPDSQFFSERDGKFLNQGNWRNDVRVTYNLSSSINPSLAIDENNDIHVVWQDYREGNWEIYYMKLSENGGKLINDMRLTNDTADSVEPKILLGRGNSRIHVIWSDNDNGSWEIYHMSLRYDNSSIELLTNKKQISDVDPADSVFPDVVLNGEGTIKIAWQDQRDGNWEIYYSVLDSNGSVLLVDTQVTMDEYQSTRCSIDVDSEGNTHIVCHEYRNASGSLDTNYGIHYIKLDPSGAVVMRKNRISIASQLSRPKIRIDSQDRLHVVFDDTRYNAAGFSDIIYTMLDRNGTTLIDDVTLTPPSDDEKEIVDSREPAVITDLHDNLHIIWMDNRHGSYGIYYTMLDPSNHTANNSLPFEEQITLIQDVRLTGSVSGSQSPNINIDYQSNLHLVWQDERSGSWEVFYTRTDKPDLAFDDEKIELSPLEPVSGEDLKISATIFDAASGLNEIPAQVDFFYIPSTELTSDERDNISWLSMYEFQALVEQKGTKFYSTLATLDAREHLDVTGVLNTTGLQGILHIVIAIDFPRVLDETDDTNNIVTESIFIRNYSVELEWDGPSVLQADVNSSISFTADILNTGNRQNEIDLVLEEDGRKWLSMDMRNLSLDINESTKISITGKVPSSSLGGIYIVQLSAVPKDQTVMTRTIVMILEVRQYSNISIDDFDEMSNVLPGYNDFSFVLVNGGNGNDSVDIVLSSEKGWDCVFSNGKKTITKVLSPREESATIINITVPNSSPADEDNLTVTATSKFDPLVSASSRTVLVVQAKRVVRIVNKEVGDVPRVSPGVSTSYSVMVENIGNVIDWYDVNFTLPSNWNGSVNISYLNLSAGEGQNLTFNVTPSPKADGGVYEIFLESRSSMDPKVYAIIKLIMYIEETYSFTLSPDNLTETGVGGPPSIEYRFYITNTGNVRTTYALLVDEIDSSSFDWWYLTTRDGDTYTFKNHSIIIELEPNEDTGVLIELLVPENANKGQYEFFFEVTESSIDSPRKTVSFFYINEDVEIVEESRFFLNMTIGVSAGTLLIIGVVVFIRWYRGRS